MMGGIMKKLIFVLTFFCLTQSWAVEKIMNSKISEVTVYFQQALVTRVAEIELERGKHELIFDRIPSDYRENSVQVKGFGNATIKDVKKNRDFVTEEPNERRQELTKTIQALQDKMNILKDQEKLARNEQDIVQSIMEKLTAKGEKEDVLNPEKWIQMVDFYRNRNISLNEELRNTVMQIRELEKEQFKLQKQIQELGLPGKKQINQIKVLVEASKAGKIKLELSYIVQNASWYPLYDVRVSSDTKVMNLTYKANISQRTNEDWNDVKLKISTAQPHAGAEHPELRPWRLNLHETNRKWSKLNKSIATKDKEMQQMHLRGGMSNEVAYAIDGMSVSDPVESYEDMAIETASTSENITSSVFEIPGTNTILSDNQEHQVTIAIEDFPAYFRYSTVPKLAPFAYLKAKVKNDSEYPFLKGEANIFLDDNFVTTASFDFAAPTDEFWTFLGVDENIKIKYKLIRKYKENLGLFGNREKQFFEYEITIKNNKKTEEEIVVWDQIPISQHEDIKIDLIEPIYEKDTDNLKLNKNKFLEWFFRLKPAEEIKIPLQFSVEYPQNKFIEGLF